MGGIEIRRIEETGEAEVSIGVVYMTHMQTGLKGVGLNCRNANILSSEENIYAAVILLASLNTPSIYFIENIPNLSTF